MAGDLPDYPQRLLDAVTANVAQWIERAMTQACEGATVEIREAVASSLQEVRSDTLAYVREHLSALLNTDVDAQQRNPLEVLRASTRFANAALREANVPRPVRDEYQQRFDPDDEFLLGPMAWMDLGESVHEAGIEWGAWKAATVLTRRRAEGKLG